MPNEKLPTAFRPKWTIDDVFIGDVVQFYSRDEWVQAAGQSRPPDPTPGILLRKHRAASGEPDGLASVMLFTESGAHVVRARYTATPEPDAWTVAAALIARHMPMLDELIRVGIVAYLTEPDQEGEEEAGEDDTGSRKKVKARVAQVKKKVAGGKIAGGKKKR